MPQVLSVQQMALFIVMYFFIWSISLKIWPLPVNKVILFLKANFRWHFKPMISQVWGWGGGVTFNPLTAMALVLLGTVWSLCDFEYLVWVGAFFQKCWAIWDKYLIPVTARYMRHSYWYYSQTYSKDHLYKRPPAYKDHIWHVPRDLLSILLNLHIKNKDHLCIRTTFFWSLYICFTVLTTNLMLTRSYGPSMITSTAGLDFVRLHEVVKINRVSCCYCYKIHCDLWCLEAMLYCVPISVPSRVCVNHVQTSEWHLKAVHQWLDVSIMLPSYVFTFYNSIVFWFYCQKCINLEWKTSFWRIYFLLNK